MNGFDFFIEANLQYQRKLLSSDPLKKAENIYSQIVVTHNLAFVVVHMTLVYFNCLWVDFNQTLFHHLLIVEIRTLVA